MLSFSTGAAFAKAALKAFSVRTACSCSALATATDSFLTSFVSMVCMVRRRPEVAAVILANRVASFLPALSDAMGSSSGATRLASLSAHAACLANIACMLEFDEVPFFSSFSALASTAACSSSTILSSKSISATSKSVPTSSTASTLLAIRALRSSISSYCQWECSEWYCESRTLVVKSISSRARSSVSGCSFRSLSTLRSRASSAASFKVSTFSSLTPRATAVHFSRSCAAVSSFLTFDRTETLCFSRVTWSWMIGPALSSISLNFPIAV
mmetsp:Transcript_7313/g.18746  ORF Transcript_7313/g.18746 Transcript_7313/m.18746 type:complete len:271 (+) Transcript_7313:1301-2113(+)